MFTGLIVEVGSISRVGSRPGGLQLVVRAPRIVADAAVGDSIACNGVCLTIESIAGEQFEAHAGVETMQRTTVHAWRPGEAVNLEPALRPTDRMGGHHVQGHVDCVGTCTGRHAIGDTWFYSFRIPEDRMVYLAEKGSVAVDGISLTITETTADGFSVAIIPHTLANTSLQNLTPGREVNIEVDILAKYVHRMLTGAGILPESGVTEDLLRRHGFID